MKKSGWKIIENSILFQPSLYLEKGMIIKMNTEKKQNIYKILMLVILTAFITFMVTSLILYKTGMISGSINENM